MREPTVWTDSMVERLRELNAAGLSHRQIAAEMGITMPSVEYKRRDLGLAGEKVRFPIEREVEISSRYRDGQSMLEIAEAMGLTYESVYQKVMRMGLRAKWSPRSAPRYQSSPWNAEMRERVEALFHDGLPISEIGKCVGLSKNTIIGWLHRNAFCKQRIVYVPTPNPFPDAGCCLYPFGDPGGPDFHFCAAPQTWIINRDGDRVRSAYCAGHHKLTHVKDSSNVSIESMAEAA